MKKILQLALLIATLAGIAAAGDASLKAPEIGPGAAASAVALLAGGLLVLRARRNK